MSKITMEFRGMCISSVAGKKTNYNKFVVQPEPGCSAVEIEISAPVSIDAGDIGKWADWKFTGIEVIKGTNANGRSYSFVKADTVHGEKVKEAKVQ